jgi:hypothetical protein
MLGCVYRKVKHARSDIQSDLVRADIDGFDGGGNRKCAEVKHRQHGERCEPMPSTQQQPGPKPRQQNRECQNCSGRPPTNDDKS